MIRRHARLRNEYLYRKSLEGKERVEYEKKAALRKALDGGKAIPTEIRPEFHSLNASMEADDDRTAIQRTHIDDEYANAGQVDPRIMISSSRGASSRLLVFAKECALFFPNSVNIPRGNTKVRDLVDAARQRDFTDIILLQEHRGKPDGMIISHLPYGPTAYFNLSNVIMRHDLPPDTVGTMSEAYPHLICDGFGNTPIGKRVQNILRFLFPVPKPDSKRVITFASRDDIIRFRHHVYQKNPQENDVELAEVGPRMDAKLYQIKLGCLDQKSAEDEWVLRPYMRTAKKRKIFQV
jgi:U3 small nucleolar ribonucleoprotein protein IMP4